MPEFVMEGRDHAARAESDFVLGFIEAMFFTECGHIESADWFDTDSDERTSDGELPSDVGYTDLHPDSLAAIRADCEAWQAANGALLQAAYATGYDEAQAGRDYWFTRNGHGVGFWERQELKSDDGAYKALSAEMVSASESGDNAAWGAASAKRNALDVYSIGARLTEACQRNEVNPFFGDHVTHGNLPFVHVDI